MAVGCRVVGWVLLSFWVLQKRGFLGHWKGFTWGFEKVRSRVGGRRFCCLGFRGMGIWIWGVGFRVEFSALGICTTEELSQGVVGLCLGFIYRFYRDLSRCWAF